MHLNLHWIISFIFLEFFLISLIVIAVYIVKLVFTIKDKNFKRSKSSLYLYIDNLLDVNKDIHPLDFAKEWYRLDVLLNLIEDFDKEKKEARWMKLRKTLMCRVLLPLAREEVYSRDWKNRLLAARVLALGAEAEDEEVIIVLLKDKSPLVNMEADLAVKHLPTKNTVNAIIDQMKDDRRRSFSLYLRAFEGMHSDMAELVLERLIAEKDPAKREICYKILTRYEIPVYYPAAYADVQSDNLELALAAICLVKHSEQERSIPLLEGLLEDERFEIQILALKLLSGLKAIDSIPYILKAIHSKKWWVRINAALALKKLGQPGIAALQSVKKEEDRLAYQEAQYILNQGKDHAI